MAMIKRRQFIQSSFLATAGAMLVNPASLFGESNTFAAKGTVPNRSLSPFLLADDLVRLVELTDLDASIRQGINENINFFQAAQVWTLPTNELLKVFKGIKANWQSESAAAQLAFCSGSVVHSVFNKWLKSEPMGELQDLPEKVIYEDTFIMKMLQNADRNRKKVPLKEVLEGVSTEAVAEVFHLMQQRNLIRTHTIKPELTKTDEWLGDFLAYYHQLDRDNAAYARVYCNPDPAKVNRYISEPNFYNENDPIIKTTRAIQMGYANNVEDIDALVANTPGSIYGKALHDGLKRLVVFGNYIEGKSSEEELKSAAGV